MKIFYPFLFASILSILQASNFESFEDESYVEDEFFRSLIRDFLDDQKFKKGLITWVKDQFDPDIINAYLKFSEKERQCFLKGMRLVKRTIVEKGFDEAMEFVDNYCPSIYDDAEMFYSWLQNLAHKSIEFIQNFHTDLPESIQAPLKKMGKLSKWIAVDENDEYEDQNVLEIYDMLDQILNATEEDRGALAKKHPFMAPFVTGKLRADSIIIVRTVIKMYKNGSIDNLDSLEVIEAFENWFDGLKQELLEYFSTRQRPDKVLKGGLDRLFTILLGGYYDSLNFDSIADVSQAYEHNKWKWL